MEIQLQNIGKRFFLDWIFSDVSMQIHSGQRLAILGSNGAGKSTLLRIISGFMIPSRGQIQYFLEQMPLKQEEVYQYVSLAAPYLDLIEEYTFAEMVDFHFRFKKMRPELTKETLFERSTLKKSKNKPIRFFSSGMKMRAKLILALASDTPLLLLDEPTSNLDNEGVVWYQNLIGELATNRTVIVSSNDEREYAFCTDKLLLEDYKNKPKKRSKK